jgi:hypothetical protein
MQGIPLSRENTGMQHQGKGAGPKANQSQFEAKAKNGSTWKRNTCGREPNFFTSEDTPCFRRLDFAFLPSQS